MTETASMSTSTFPHLINISTIIGHSKALSRYEENIRPKDSVITLPCGFATSTPKSLK